MPRIINTKDLSLSYDNAPMKEYEGYSSQDVAKLAGLKDFSLHVCQLKSGQFSCPYHFHHHAEEMFVILSGVGTLRTEKGLTPVGVGDVILFEEGKCGAHQLANEGDDDLVYLDLRSIHALDVCEYPDTNKVNILPARETYFKGNEAEYFEGEEKLSSLWKRLPHLSR